MPAGPCTSEIGPLRADEQREIVRRRLAQHRKTLDERPGRDQLGRLLSRTGAAKPLYLVTACEELRVFGHYERVDDRIAALPDGIPDLFAQVLQRLEQDHGEPLVRDALGLVASARNGLLERELLELLGSGDTPFPHGTWARLYRPLRAYLVPPSDEAAATLGFFHAELTEAVRRRYLATSDAAIGMHRQLAGYFHRKADPLKDASWQGRDPRGAAELPYHLRAAGDWPQLTDVLCDLGFIEAKCRLGMTHDLVGDLLEATGPDLPDAHRVRLAAFARFTREHSHALATDARLTFQLAINHPTDSVPGEAARQRLAEGQERRPWMRLVNAPEDERARLMTIDAFPGNTAMLGTFASDQQRILCADMRGTAAVHDARTGARILTSGPSGAFFSFSPDRALAIWRTYDWASTDDRAVVTLFDVASGSEMATRTGTFDEFISLACVALPGGARMAAGTRSGVVDVWDVATDQRVAAIDTGGTIVDSVVFSPAGTHLLAINSAGARVWRIDTGSEVAVLSDEAWTRRERFAFSPDGHIVAAVVADTSNIRLTDLSTGGEIGVLTVPEARDGTRVRSLRFGPRARLLVAAVAHPPPAPWEDRPNGSVEVWDLGGQTPEEPISLSLWETSPASVGLTADGAFIAVGGGEGTVQIYTAGGARCARIDTRSSAVHDCSFSDDGSVLLTCGQDGTVKLWDVATLRGWYREREVKNRTRRRATAAVRSRDVTRANCHGSSVVSGVFSPSGDRLLSASSNGGLALWDVEAGDATRVIRSDDGDASDVECVFASDGVRVLAPDERRMAVWSVADGFLTTTGGFTDSASWQPRSRNIAQFTPDEARIIANHSSAIVGTWDAATGREVSRFDRRRHYASVCALSPDGSRLVVNTRRKRLTMWQLEPERPVMSFVGHDAEILSCAFAGDGGRLVSASEDRTVRIWNARTGRQRAVCTGHTAAVVACRFSPDGTRVLSGSKDGTVRVWDAATGRPLFALRSRHLAVETARFSPDGRFIASGAGDSVRIWDEEGGDLCAYGPTVWSPSSRGARTGERSLRATGSDGCTSCGWNISERGI